MCNNALILELPHIKDLLSRSTTIITNDKAQINQMQHSETAINPNPKKKDIITDGNLKHLQMQAADNYSLIPTDVSSGASAPTVYSHQTCPICLEFYQEGDDICWSRNQMCCHAYHSECMVGWLMNSDECCLCACNFLQGHVDENEDRTSSK